MLFLSRLVYSTTILKELHLKSQPYPLAHAKHPLIHHLPQNHYHFVLNKSARLKASWTGNHRVSWPACTFVIIRQLFLKCI